MNNFVLAAYHRLPAPARSAAATLRGHYLRWWRYGAASERLVREALERDLWSPEEWRRWRDEHLPRQLERAATRIPYYRAYWRARRRHGDRASWDLLENWPILEKETVRAQPRAFVADDCAVRRMSRVQTSGSSGIPLDIWRSRETDTALRALGAARTRAWHGVPARVPWARLGGQLVIPAAQRQPPFWVWNAAQRQLYMSTYHLAPDLIPDYLDALASYGIRYLSAYTSSLEALAHTALDLGRDDLRMLVAFTNGEPVSEHQRATISAAFGCAVRETYGMAESVAWASECAAGRLHLWPEVGIVEVHDGELICTGLLNRDMPLVRYRTGDRGRLAPEGSTCSCGRTLPLVEAIEGRANDVLVTRDGRQVSWLNPVWYGIPVREAQIVQETLGRVRARYAPAPGFTTATGQTVVERLRERLGDIEVLLEEVPAVPRSANGKRRAVVCNVSPTERAEMRPAAPPMPVTGATAVPRVSVVIPCRNEARHIAACLDAILATDYSADAVEVLVVDGMSDDGTRALLARYAAAHSRIRMVDNPQRITPAALNLGIQAATGDVIMRMDAHVVYPPEYIPRAVAALEASGADNVGGVIATLPGDDTIVARAIAIALNLPLGGGRPSFRIGTREPQVVDTLAFGCWRAELFDRIGLFDEELVRNQDVEFNGRIANHGGRVLLVPDIVSYYYARRSLWEVVRKRYQYGYFKPLVAKKLGRGATVQELVSPLFAAGIVGSALLGLGELFFGRPVFAWLTGAGVAVYAAAATVSTALTWDRQGWRCALALAAVFPTIHVAYGLGLLRGVLDHLVLPRRSPAAGAAVSLSR
jgi:phenylacetate-CoA ligase